MSMCNAALSLIVTIVNKGQGEAVVEAVKKAGAEGSTVLPGRGTGIHERVRILGMPVEPEKEIVLTLIPTSTTSRMLEAIEKAVSLSKPGQGLAFVIDVERAIGICHAVLSNINPESESADQ